MTDFSSLSIYTQINVTLTPHQRNISSLKMEIITENPNMSQCRDQWIMLCINSTAPTPVAERTSQERGQKVL